MMQEATAGNQFVLTEKGYRNTPDHVKHEREVGVPVKGFETRVPATWINKGYVMEKESHEHVPCLKAGGDVD